MPTNPSHLRPPLTSIHSVLEFYAQQKRGKREQVFCFQVGANDGKQNDPVNPYFTHYGWKGLLVEPQADVFLEGLVKTYEGNKNVILENAALGTSAGEIPFYRVAISKARWATGLSTFDRPSLESHITNGYVQQKAKEDGLEIPSDPSALIETVKVPTLTISNLLSKHSISSFDVLCIDTEGYDFQILQLIDWKKYLPQLVIFESKNLSDQDYIAAKKLLSDAGYQLYWEKGDTLAINFTLPFFQAAKFKVRALKRKVRIWQHQRRMAKSAQQN